MIGVKHFEGIAKSQIRKDNRTFRDSWSLSNSLPRAIMTFRLLLHYGEDRNP